MFSILSSFFNVEKMLFAWREALDNWLTFLNGSGQLSIVINTSEDDSARLVREWLARYKLEKPWCKTTITVTDAAISYDDPEFDGKLKAVALSHCDQPYCILLDCDERLVPSMRRHWARLVLDFENGDQRIDAFLIPVIDLYGDEDHYRAIGSKWYLHRNLPNLTRGVVQFAYREDGSIDTSKSDTCELIYRDTRQLVRAVPLISPVFPHFMIAGQLDGGEVPFVYHLGWLDKMQRLRQSEFWRPVWGQRNRRPVEAAASMAELEAIQKYAHRLPTWRTNQ